ncbi:MAG: hypothetical protein AAF389_16235 [Gemmatimonadota bacterium]
MTCAREGSAMRRYFAIGTLAAVVAVGLPTKTEAQSLFNAAGLGTPLEPLDARARALGSLGIGLPGGSFMPTDPGALGRLTVSTGVMVAQPSWLDYEAGASTGQVQGNRFPLLGIAYPVLSGMMSIQIGSFLDQHYQTQRIGSADFGGGTFQTTDDFLQDGSISSLNIGYARMFGSRVSAGAIIGRYAGSVVRTLTRTYGDENTTDVDDYVERGEWSYTGESITAGVAVDPLPGVRVAVSAVLPTSLDATAVEGTSGANRTFDMPRQYRAGASAQLVSGLVVTGSMQLMDWSSTADDLSEGDEALDSNGFGLGVEFSRARLWGKDAPLRFGFRRTGLPFSFEDGSGTERAFGGGFGLELSRSGDVVLASVDLAIERGQRSGAGLTERFWRATISLLASGL